MILVTCPSSNCTWKKNIQLKRNLSRSIDNHVKKNHKPLYEEHMMNLKNNNR